MHARVEHSGGREIAGKQSARVLVRPPKILPHYGTATTRVALTRGRGATAIHGGVGLSNLSRDCGYLLLRGAVGLSYGLPQVGTPAVHNPNPNSDCYK